MKNVEKILVQRDRKKMRQGWAARISVAALGASFLLAALAPTPARADGAAVTQLQYLQWLAQSSGAQFNAGSSASAYVNWAVSTGLNPTSSGGWVPNAVLSKDVLAQTLVQKFGLTQNKFGGDHARTLARQGLDLSNIGAQVNRDNLAGLVDQFGYQALTILSLNNNKWGGGGDNGGQGGGGIMADKAVDLAELRRVATATRERDIETPMMTCGLQCAIRGIPSS